MTFLLISYLTGMQNERSAKLAFITIACVVCFNFPILRLFGKKTLIFGVPQLYFIIFLIWMVVIIATYFTLRSRKS